MNVKGTSSEPSVHSADILVINEAVCDVGGARRIKSADLRCCAPVEEFWHSDGSRLTHGVLRSKDYDY
jgi:hypothetical protein